MNHGQSPKWKPINFDSFMYKLMWADDSFMNYQWWKRENKITSGVHKCSIFDEIMYNVLYDQYRYYLNIYIYIMYFVKWALDDFYQQYFWLILFV